MLLLLLACAPPSVGCDFRDGGANGPENRCQERTGAQAAGFSQMCSTLSGEPVDGGCPMDGVVAGCSDGSVPAGEVIDWYYAPETLETVTAECEDGTVIEP